MVTKSIKSYESIPWECILEYTNESPSGLVWRISPSNHISAGRSAGSISNKKTCWELRYKKKTWLAHRIVWILHNGSTPLNLVINHKDCNPLNNNIENLEVVSIADNNRRTKRHIAEDKTLGVHLLRTTRKGKEYFYYSSFYRDENGNVIRKCFAILKYGDDVARRMAEEFRADGLSKTGLQYGQPY